MQEIARAGFWPLNTAQSVYLVTGLKAKGLAAMGILPGVESDEYTYRLWAERFVWLIPEELAKLLFPRVSYASVLQSCKPLYPLLMHDRCRGIKHRYVAKQSSQHEVLRPRTLHDKLDILFGQLCRVLALCSQRGSPAITCHQQTRCSCYRRSSSCRQDS